MRATVMEFICNICRAVSAGDIYKVVYIYIVNKIYICIYDMVSL